MADLSEEEADISSATRGGVILIILTLIVVISVVFEKAKEFALDESSKSVKPIVNALFGEMTVLGFIGLVLFLVVQTDALDSVSESVFGERETLQELVEDVHMVLFAVMVLYLLLCFWLSRLGTHLVNGWRQKEDWAGRETEACVALASELANKKGSMRGRGTSYFGWKCCESGGEIEGAVAQATLPSAWGEVPSVRRARETVGYLSRRNRFVNFPINKVGVDAKLMNSMDQTFAFDEYLSLAMSDVAVEIVEVPPLTWIGLEAVFLLFYAGMELEGLAQLSALTAFGYVLLLTLLAIFVKLSRIERAVTPTAWQQFAYQLAEDLSTLPGVTATSSTTTNQYQALIEPSSNSRRPDYGSTSRGTAAVTDVRPQCSILTRDVGEGVGDPPPLNDPPYAANARPVLLGSSSTSSFRSPGWVTRRPQQPRTWFWKAVLGIEPTAYEKLFWLDRKGTDLIIFLIRYLLLLNSIYVSVFVTLLVSEWSSTLSCFSGRSDDNGSWCAVVIVAGMLPVLGFLRLLEPTLRKFVEIAHIESWRSEEFIASTVRLMKTRKALVAIRLLARLASLNFVDTQRTGTSEEKAHIKIPKPVDTSHVSLSPQIEELTELLAETNHNDWCRSKREQGWFFGSTRDNEKKIHPELTDFKNLPEESKDYNRKECLSQLKVIVALGFDILHDPSTNSVSELGEIIVKLGEMLAANTHQGWARARVDQGWTHGDIRDEEAKTDPLLISFADLDEHVQEVNRRQAMATLHKISEKHYRFVRRERSKSPLAARRLSRVESAALDGREDIKQAFNLFDPDKKGYVYNTDVLSALHSLGWALSETDAVGIIREMDHNRSGTVEYIDFASWITKQERENQKEVDPDILVRRAFEHIDVDRSGAITAQELLSALRGLGEDELEYDDVQEIIRDADTNADNTLDEEEFSKLLKTVLLAR